MFSNYTFLRINHLICGYLKTQTDEVEKKPSSGLSLSILAFQPLQVWRWLKGAPQIPISLFHEESQRKDVPLDSLALSLIFPIWKFSLNVFCCVLFITIPVTSWLYLLEFRRQVQCHCVCDVMSTGLTSVGPWALSSRCSSDWLTRNWHFLKCVYSFP